MYVQYVKLFGPYARAKYPLLLWHGGGLSGVTWETKRTANRAGSSSSSAPGTTSTCRTRSSAGAPPGRAIRKYSRPSPFSAPKKEAWELFRIGPADSYATIRRCGARHAEGTQFPVAAFDQFAKARQSALGHQTTPRRRRPTTRWCRRSAPA